MESSAPKPDVDAIAPSIDPPAPSPSTPPPLPQQIQRFRAACWIGLISGGFWAFCGGVVLLITLLKPMSGVLTGLPFFVLPPAAFAQGFTAYLLLKGRSRVLQIFCASSILVALIISLGSIIFGVLNLVPIILLMWSAASAPARTEAGEQQETPPVASDLPSSPHTPAESREDIY